MDFHLLEDWLDWQESLNPKAIELGLDRVRMVWGRLGGLPPTTTVITVAGTNGKGSSIAMLEAILLAAGFKVGCYTSPHLLRFNERIRIGGHPLDDEAIMAAFRQVEKARVELPLTFFEYGTLAALKAFACAGVDVALLEVGLGGRLDATNVVDAQGALIATIDLDHQEWLGEDREAIGFEKAGIFRPGAPAVFSGLDVPDSIVKQAEQLGTPLLVYGRDYEFELEGVRWNLRQGGRIWRSLALPALEGQHQLRNAAGVLVLIEALKGRLPVNCAAVEAGLTGVKVAARQQLVRGEVSWLLDVAHNPQAISELRARIDRIKPKGRVLALFGMLADKDAPAAFRLLADRVDGWYLAGLSGSRGQTAEHLAEAAKGIIPEGRIKQFADVQAALDRLETEAVAGDLAVVFGSFHTLGDVMARLDEA